jgi:hydroxymethylglutaryl-CoA reductase (NADPH)
MVALTRAGGVTTRVLADENRATPQLTFADVEAAVSFARALPELFDELRAAAEATTRHGKLLRVVPRVSGHDVLVDLVYSTGDAGGANLVARASDAVCRLLVARFAPRAWTLMSGAEGEKRASASLFAGGKGKSVVAGARLPARVLRTVLGVEAEPLAALCRRTAAAQIVSGTVGANAQLANGLAALFIACGQDVANIANAATGVTTLEAEEDGTLVASLCLPSLVVATVGGGTAVGTAPECLGLLGCAGSGRALAFAEIVAGTLLAGELSFSAALASGEHAAAHERYGRNRPAAGD